MSQDYLAENTSLCDALDRVLNKGVVLHGELNISVAGVELLHVNLRGLICASDQIGRIDCGDSEAGTHLDQNHAG